MGYDAFISCSRQETEKALFLRSKLIESGISAWMAVTDLNTGTDYVSVYSDAIQEASCFILFLSKKALLSAWMLRETTVAKEHGLPIIPILLEDVELPSVFWFIKDLKMYRVDQTDAIIDAIKACVDNPAPRTEKKKTAPPEASMPEKKTAPAPSSSDPLIFLSYKSADIDIAQDVDRFLTERGHNVFFSERSLPNIGNSEYFEAIDEALDKAQHMVIIADSREKLNSKWVKHEWSSFLNEKRSGRKNGNLVVVITENMKIDQLPYSLRQVEVIPISELEKVCCFLVDKTNQKSSMQIVPDSIPAAHQRTKQKKKLSKKYVPLAILILVLITGWLVTALPKGTSRSAPGPTPSLISNNEASSDTRSPDGKRATPTVSIAMNSKYFSVGDQVQASWSTVGLDIYTYSIVKDGKTKLQFTLPTTKEKTTETITYTPEVPGTYYVHVTGYQIINGEKTPVVTVQKPFDVAND